MEMIVIKTKPSKPVILFGIIGTLFFGAFTYKVISSEWGVDNETNYYVGMSIIWITTLALLLFTLACFGMFLSLKTITLTNQNLIIKRPLLLYRKIVPLQNIRGIIEKDYRINPSHDGLRLNVYKGHECIIELSNGKKIKFNSLEIPSYYEVIGIIQKRCQKPNNDKIESQPESTSKVNLIGWILILSLLTFGLFYAMIFKK